MEVIQHFISRSDNWVRDAGKDDERVKLLQTIPGIGVFLALLITHEIGDVNRFRTEKKLDGYAGLIPSTYASGARVFHERITKQGNKRLR